MTLYVVIPKGFFPEQDNGVLIGVSEAGQDVSFAEMQQRQLAIAKVIAQDPDIAGYAMTIGAGLGGQTENQGRIFIALKPFSERHATAQQIIARLRPKLDRVMGIQPVPAGVAGHPRRRPAEQDAVPVHAAGRERRGALCLGAEGAGEAARPADAARPDQRRADGRPHPVARPSTATAPRASASRRRRSTQTLYDAFGQEQVTQYFTQVNTYHVILEVLPSLQGKLSTLNSLYVRSSIRPGGAALGMVKVG